MNLACALWCVNMWGVGVLRMFMLMTYVARLVMRVRCMMGCAVAMRLRGGCSICVSLMLILGVDCFVYVCPCCGAVLVLGMC